LPHLEAAAAEPRCAAAVLVPLAAAIGATDWPRSTGLLGRALIESHDSMTAASMLAKAAADAADWAEAGRLVRRVLAGARPTLDVPWPSALPPTVWKLAYEGPPSIAAPVLVEARERFPSWELAWHGGASAMVRAGSCDEGWRIGRELTRFGWTAEEIRELLRRCPEP
jgi:hypothetical protein